MLTSRPWPAPREVQASRLPISTLAARIDFPEVKYSKRGTLRWELIGLEKKRPALGGRAIALGIL